MKIRLLIGLLCFLCFALNETNASIHSARLESKSPLSSDERQIATDELITLLKETKYFDFIDSRIHGVPEDNDQNKFWYGHMWTGVVATKKNGIVTYTHQNNGSDNVGIHSAPYLESACYAYLMTGDKRYSHLARKVIRGFSSWILSSSRTEGEKAQILSRSFYPASFHSLDQGRDLFVDYEASRPGVHHEVSDYVHIPNNPYFGDLWVKNNRSIDDIGQMIRSMTQVQACKNVFDDEARADLDQMNELYSTWAKSVEENKFIIPTFDLNASIVTLKKGLGDFGIYDYLGFNPNCAGKLAVHLLHNSSTQNFHCGNGISALENIFGLKLQNDALEIVRSHHIASLGQLKLKTNSEMISKFTAGLNDRVDRDFQIATHPENYPTLDVQDVPTFFIHAHNVGASLTSDEIRFVYQRLHTAFVEMRAPEHFSTYNLFDPKITDGQYSFDPPSRGLYFYTLGPMLGTCISPLRNKDSEQIFDCERLKKAFQKL